MPKDIEKVVNALADLRNSSPELISHTIRENFLRMIEDDPWLGHVRALLSRSQ
jgi:Tat protein secretion system quality control protein TatD with DNase activity